MPPDRSTIWERSASQAFGYTSASFPETPSIASSVCTVHLNRHPHRKVSGRIQVKLDPVEPPGTSLGTVGASLVLRFKLGDQIEQAQSRMTEAAKSKSCLSQS